MNSSAERHGRISLSDSVDLPDQVNSSPRRDLYGSSEMRLQQPSGFRLATVVVYFVH